VADIRLVDLPERAFRRFVRDWLGDDPWDRTLDCWTQDGWAVVPVECHGARLLLASFLAQRYADACAVHCGSSRYDDLSPAQRATFVGLWCVVTPEGKHLYTDDDNQGIKTALPACARIKAVEGRRVFDEFIHVRAEDFAQEAHAILARLPIS
jgi:hypothetical protein